MKYLGLLFLLLSSNAFAEKAKICVPMFNKCVYAQISWLGSTFFTADPEEFKKVKLHSQSFPIRLITQPEMDLLAQGPIETSDVPSDAVIKLGEGVESAHNACRISAGACTISATGWLSSMLKTGPEAALLPFAAAVLTCSSTFINCKAYWDKYVEYEKSVQAELKANHDAILAGGGGGGESSGSSGGGFHPAIGEGGSGMTDQPGEGCVIITDPDFPFDTPDC